MDPSQFINKNYSLMNQMDSLNYVMSDYDCEISNSEMCYSEGKFIATPLISETNRDNGSTEPAKTPFAQAEEKTKQFFRIVNPDETFTALERMTQELIDQTNAFPLVMQQSKKLEERIELIRTIDELKGVIEDTNKLGISCLIDFYKTHPGNNPQVNQMRIRHLESIQERLDKLANQLVFGKLYEKETDFQGKLLGYKWPEDKVVMILNAFLDPKIPEEHKRFLFELRVSTDQPLPLWVRSSKKKIISIDTKIIGKGVYKICTRALQMRESEVVEDSIKSPVKDMVVFRAVTPEGYDKEVEVCLAGSKLLHNPPNGVNPERANFFAKYKKITYINCLTGESTSSLVMAYANGGELKDQLKKLTPEMMFTYTRDLVAAGSYMEEIGVVHRDLKPQNILIRDRRILIIDFGFMCKESEVEKIKGTPIYEPPTLEHNLRYFPKHDSFSMGLILLQISTRGKFVVGGDEGEATARGFFSKSYQSKRWGWFNDLRECLITKLPGNPLASLIGDLIEPDPTKRISLSEAYARFNDVKLDHFVINTICDQLPKRPRAVDPTVSTE